MSASRSSIPSAPAFISFVLKPLPLFPLQPLLALCIKSILYKRPQIFDRLGEHAGKRIGLNPTDFPFAFVLDTHPQCPSAKAVRELSQDLDAQISGPLFGLMGLADGSYDGDALFFSRDLTVEGDMEAVVALRNALDDAQIDFIEIAATNLGPFASVAETAMRKALFLFREKQEQTTYHREAKPWN